MGLLRYGFKSKAAGDVNAKTQYRFSGDVEGNCYVTIASGKLKAGIGNTNRPEATIDAPFDVRMDILTGEADGQPLAAQGKYGVAGDVMLLGRLRGLFR